MVPHRGPTRRLPYRTGRDRVYKKDGGCLERSAPLSAMLSARLSIPVRTPPAGLRTPALVEAMPAGHALLGKPIRQVCPPGEPECW